MKMKLNYIRIVYWIFICFQFGCSKNKENSINDNLDMKEWECHQVSNEEICLPKYWSPIKQDKAYFFSYLENEDMHSFFAIVSYDVIKDSINSDLYLKEMYNQLINSNDEEIFEGYTLSKLNFSDYISYYGEYYTKIHTNQYFTYSMVVEYKSKLYELILKVPRSQFSDYNEIFQKILTHFKVSGKPIFKTSDEILNKEIINLHD